jgi:hypothetical protein
MRLVLVVMSLLSLGGVALAQYAPPHEAAPTLPVVGTTPAPHLFPPRLAVLASLNDADQIAHEDQPFQRYLYLPDLAYAPTFAIAQRLGINLISRESQFAYPHAVTEGLWRIDLRDYQTNPKVFEKLGAIDPYFHRTQTRVIVEEIEEEVEYDQSYGYYGSDGKFVHSYYQRDKKKVKRQERRTVTRRFLYAPQAAGQLASLALLLQSDAPIVRADWFLVQTARQTTLNNREDTGTGYYDFLELASLKDYFRLIGQNSNPANSKILIQAVVNSSGVSAQNRIVQRDGCDTGGHWTTLDVFNQSGRGIAINHLRVGEFVADVNEHFAPLPNGLPVTFLNDAKGVRQSSAPDKIGGNRSPLNPSADTRIHDNIACLQCHGPAVLMGVEDTVRPTYTGRLGVLTNDKSLDLELKRQYKANLNRTLDQDRGLYQDAYSTVTGKQAKEAINTYSGAFTTYAYSRVDLKTASVELGVTPGAFLKALKDGAQRLGSSDFRLDPFLTTPPQSVDRLTWEDSFGEAQFRLYGVLQAQPGGQ